MVSDHCKLQFYNAEASGGCQNSSPCAGLHIVRPQIPRAIRRAQTERIK